MNLIYEIGCLLLVNQLAVVPLLEGVHVKVDALALEKRHSVTVDGVGCVVLLPGRKWNAGDRLSPPSVGSTEVDSDWPSIDWGSHNTSGEVTVRALGLLLLGTQLGTGERLANFDQAVGRWRRLIRDWLAALAGGPTDYLVFEHGDTVWADHHLNQDLMSTSYHSGEIYEPRPLTAWEFEHGLLHAEVDDPPPLAWTLLTTAMRSAAIGDTRSAVIDAATAVEVALTEALRSRLSPEASPQVVAAILDRSRMLGARLELAREFALPLPASIQAALVRPRNNLVHRGEEVSGRQVESAVAVALEVVSTHTPLGKHCQEPL